MLPAERISESKRIDFQNSPYLVLWELTRACALACRHCRARAIKRRNPLELNSEEISLVLDQVLEFGRPLLVLTGGDPFERPDLIDIVKQAKIRGLKVAITPSATEKVSQEKIKELAEAGIERLAISLDGCDAKGHDLFRGVSGSFERTMQIIEWAHESRVPIQINTSVSKYNQMLLDEIHSKVRQLNPVLWSLFFLVPTGRANSEMQISAEVCEEILRSMSLMALKSEFDIKATAAPHFRRLLLETFFLQKEQGCGPEDLSSLSPQMKLGALRSYQSVNDGKGVLFISHTGDVYPSGFLPLSAGNIRETTLANIYRNSALFNELRDPSILKGKCKTCRFNRICGGSRARAFAETADYLAEDSLCSYVEQGEL